MVLITGLLEMVSESDLVAVVRLASFTCTVKVLVPEVVGVPVIAPEDTLRVRPVGNVPEVIDHVYEAFPPVAVSDWV